MNLFSLLSQPEWTASLTQPSEPNHGTGHSNGGNAGQIIYLILNQVNEYYHCWPTGQREWTTSLIKTSSHWNLLHTLTHMSCNWTHSTQHLINTPSRPLPTPTCTTSTASLKTKITLIWGIYRHYSPTRCTSIKSRIQWPLFCICIFPNNSYGGIFSLFNFAIRVFLSHFPLSAPCNYQFTQTI